MSLTTSEPQRKASPNVMSWNLWHLASPARARGAPRRTSTPTSADLYLARAPPRGADRCQGPAMTTHVPEDCRRLGAQPPPRRTPSTDATSKLRSRPPLLLPDCCDRPARFTGSPELRLGTLGVVHPADTSQDRRSQPLQQVGVAERGTPEHREGRGSWRLTWMVPWGRSGGGVKSLVVVFF